MAKSMWTRSEKDDLYPKTMTIRVPSQHAHFETDKGPITNNVRKQLYDLIETKHFKVAFQKQHGTTMDYFHWESLRRLTNSLTQAQKGAHMKAVQGQWPTMDILAKRANSEVRPKCPLCGNLGDSNKHVIFCTHESNATIHDEYSKDLSLFLKDI